jgi:hypothetical protein
MTSFREAITRVQGFLLEPAPAGAARDSDAPGTLSHREVRSPLDADQRGYQGVRNVEVVMLGLSGGAGVTTLARGLAASLAISGKRPSHILTVGGRDEPTPEPENIRRGGPLLGAGTSASTWRLPARLREPAMVADHGDMVARGAGRPSALVWDVSPGEAESVEAAAARADAVVLVAGRDCEPSLAVLVSSLVGERYPRVVLVANRVTDRSRWDGRSDVCIPDSRLGAVLIGRGWRPGAALGEGLAQLAALTEKRA